MEIIIKVQRIPKGQTLYIDQNLSQVCQPEFFWRMWIFLLKKPGIFYPKNGHFKISIKNRLQTIPLLFELASSSIEVFWGASD